MGGRNIEAGMRIWNKEGPEEGRKGQGEVSAGSSWKPLVVSTLLLALCCAGTAPPSPCALKLPGPLQLPGIGNPPPTHRPECAGPCSILQTLQPSHPCEPMMCARAQPVDPCC